MSDLVPLGYLHLPQSTQESDVDLSQSIFSSQSSSTTPSSQFLTPPNYISSQITSATPSSQDTSSLQNLELVTRQLVSNAFCMKNILSYLPLTSLPKLRLTNKKVKTYVDSSY